MEDAAPLLCLEEENRAVAEVEVDEMLSFYSRLALVASDLRARQSGAADVLHNCR